MTYRQKALNWALNEVGTKESPPDSNSGTRVRFYQSATDLGGTGWAWCMAFVQAAFREAGLPLPFKTASVGQFLAFARQQRWVVLNPRPGDVVCYDWNTLLGPGKGDWPDHVGIVKDVLVNGTFVAVEGNTSIGNDSNGGQVMLRTRNESMVEAYVRVPGTLPNPVPSYDMVVGRGKKRRVLAKPRTKRWLLRHPLFAARLLTRFGTVRLRRKA